MSEAARIMDAVLWVSHPDMMLERLAGLTLLERQLFTLARAGVRRVWIAAQFPRDARKESLRWPEGLETLWVSTGASPAVPCEPPYAGISADHLVRIEALERLLCTPEAKHVAYQDESGRGVIQIIPHRTDISQDYERRRMPAGSCVFVQKPPDKGPALPWLLQGAVKSHDGFMARYFDRRISLATTRILLNSSVRPNHMTLLSTFIGLAGSALFLLETRTAMIAGSIVLWLHSVLDGCDGELARLRFQESRLGGVLDFWGDNLVHVSLFACLGVGLYRLHRDPAFLALGCSAVVAVIGSALAVFRHSARRVSSTTHGPFFSGLHMGPPGSGKEAPVGRMPRTLALVENLLTQRDFIYLLMLLACVDRMEEFLWAAGIGAPLFLVALLYLRWSTEVGHYPNYLRRRPL